MSKTLDTPLVSQIIQPFVAPITGEIAVDGAPVGALPFVSPGAGGGETTEESGFLLVPMIPITGSEFSPPVRVTAHRGLRRFHRREAQERILLFSDMAQPTTAAKFFRKHQFRIARDLLATSKE